jgi:hypothetical protein
MIDSVGPTWPTYMGSRFRLPLVVSSESIGLYHRCCLLTPFGRSSFIRFVVASVFPLFALQSEHGLVALADITARLIEIHPQCTRSWDPDGLLPSWDSFYWPFYRRHFCFM